VVCELSYLSWAQKVLNDTNRKILIPASGLIFTLVIILKGL